MDDTTAASLAHAARQALDGDSAGLLALPPRHWCVAAHLLTLLLAARVATTAPCHIDDVTFWTTDGTCTFAHNDDGDDDDDGRLLWTAASMVATDTTATLAGHITNHERWAALWLAVPPTSRADLLTVLATRLTTPPTPITTKAHP